MRRVSTSNGLSKKSSLQKSHNIHLVANHSKNSSKELPDNHDHSLNVLQVSINKDLLDGMLTSFCPDSESSKSAQFPTLFSWICHQSSLDPDEVFSDRYILHLQQLEETSPNTTPLPKGLSAARNIRDLVSVLGTIVLQLGLGGGAFPGNGRTSDGMRIVYLAERGGNGPMDHIAAPYIKKSGMRHGFIGHPLMNNGTSNAQQSDKYGVLAPSKKRRLSKNPEPASRLQVFHHHDVIFDRRIVDHEVASMLEFWYGRRKMLGPIGRAELDFKCGSCPFRQKCPQM
jgi:hypothetical protein